MPKPPKDWDSEEPPKISAKDSLGKQALGPSPMPEAYIERCRRDDDPKAPWAPGAERSVAEVVRNMPWEPGGLLDWPPGSMGAELSRPLPAPTGYSQRPHAWRGGRKCLRCGATREKRKSVVVSPRGDRAGGGWWINVPWAIRSVRDERGFVQLNYWSGGYGYIEELWCRGKRAIPRDARPKLPLTGKLPSPQVHITLPVKVFDRLVRLAERDGRSLSNYAHCLIHLALELGLTPANLIYMPPKETAKIKAVLRRLRNNRARS